MDTLVLDARYAPVARVSWFRALGLLFARKAEVVEVYEDRAVRSVTVEFAVPSVVRFVRAIRRGPDKVRFSRENVFARDRGRCQYCSRVLARAEATWDHVVPRKQGGHTRWTNIVIACVPCNQRKGGRTPHQAGMTLRRLPEEPRYLSGGVCLTLAREPIPESWRAWLRDAAYWHVKLEED